MRRRQLKGLWKRLGRGAALSLDNEAKRRAAARAAVVVGVERLARTDRRVAALAKSFDADPFLLNTTGGIVDLRSGTMRSCNPAALCSKATAVAPAPGGTVPERWMRFLREITGEKTDLFADPAETLIAYYQRMTGYMLTGDTSEHAVFVAHGVGANGKSVFLNTLRGMMGDYAITAPAELFLASKMERHPTELADLRGARLMVASEIDEGQRWHEARLKSVTGGEPIKARLMRQDFFTFQPQFKPLIAGNHRPSLRNVDETVRRRMNLLPFEVTIAKADRDLKLTDKLREEWPVILRWAIDGCLEWQKGGLKPPRRVVEATNNYLSEQDVFEEGLDECCVRNANAWASSTELFTSWRLWGIARGEYIGSQKRFVGKLTDHGFEPKRTNQRKGFAGVRLTDGQAKLVKSVIERDRYQGHEPDEY